MFQVQKCLLVLPVSLRTLCLYCGWIHARHIQSCVAFIWIHIWVNMDADVKRSIVIWVVVKSGIEHVLLHIFQMTNVLYTVQCYRQVTNDSYRVTPHRQRSARAFNSTQFKGKWNIRHTEQFFFSSFYTNKILTNWRKSLYPLNK